MGAKEIVKACVNRCGHPKRAHVRHAYRGQGAERCLDCGKVVTFERVRVGAVPVESFQHDWCHTCGTDQDVVFGVCPAHLV